MLHRLGLPLVPDQPDHFYQQQPTHGRCPILYRINRQMEKSMRWYPELIHLFRHWLFLLKSGVTAPVLPLPYAVQSPKEPVWFSVVPMLEITAHRQSVSVGECPSNAAQKWSMSQSTLPITRNTVFY